jgi:zona occludens toxin (predicted ATPase)
VLSAVDVIGRVFQKEVRKVNKRTKKETKKRLPHVRVGTHDSLVTGDRFNLDAVLVNPTIPQILEIAHIGNDNSEEE